MIDSVGFAARRLNDDRMKGSFFTTLRNCSVVMGRQCARLVISEMYGRRTPG